MKPVNRGWVAVCALLTLSLVGAGEEEPKVSIPEGAVEFGGHHYLLFDKVEDLSWANSRKHCADQGGTLAVVTSSEEADFIAGLCDGRYMFLGASDKETEGSWVWVDGTNWGFANWMDGQPNDYGGTEDYLATYDEGLWVDVEDAGSGFWMPTGFICEWSE